MVQISKLVGSAAAVVLLAPAMAHPGEHHDHQAIKRQIAQREHLAGKVRRSIDSCNNTYDHRQVARRSAARRSNVVRDLREKRGITAAPKKYKRDLATLEEFDAISHNRTGIDKYSFETPEDIIFSGNTSCVVTPEVTAGPYYVTGETIRKNVKEELYSEGVDLFLEVQYIDINTCQPVPDVWVNIWNCNATGIYSGISVSGNYAAEGYNSTYLRGIQPTDGEGVVSFETIFPGHYEGRATHTHLLAHMNVTHLPNNTITATNNITHIGQLFWNSDLRDAVEELYPYNTNTQTVTTNAEDMWDILQAGTYYDPFPEYVYLGEDLSDGLFAWIQIGIDPTTNFIDDDYYAVAAVLQADGGHAETSSLTGGGFGGNGTMNGTAPGNTTLAST